MVGATLRISLAFLALTPTDVMSIIQADMASIMEINVMAVPKSVITEAELEVLKVLWLHQPLTSRELTEQLYDEVNRSSMGTVQKLIARLEEKDMVNRDRSSSVHQFSAAVTREEVAGMQLEEFASKLSGGSLSPFVMHLVQAKRLSKKEKKQIRRLLEE
jgi:BlaI family transcriptional regulator, penicillinase repressor